MVDRLSWKMSICVRNHNIDEMVIEYGGRGGKKRGKTSGRYWLFLHTFYVAIDYYNGF